VTEQERMIWATAQMKLSARMNGSSLLTSEEIREVVLATIQFYGASSLDPEPIIRDLEASFQTRIGTPMVLAEPDEVWQPWVPARKAEIRWAFWDRYEQHLLQEGWAATTRRRLDETTDRVLGLLIDPRQDGSWDRRGMVVGDVQSGKTSHYIGLISKAADAGYQLIVVLAGFHNSLRSQTQIRLEEGFLGFDKSASNTNALSPLGVGLIDPRPRANAITTRANNGDFQRQVANQFAIHPGGPPLLFVVKKNHSVLKNLLNWVEWVAQGSDVIRRVPLLVVDDEADQGSVDTNQLEFDEFGNPDDEHSPVATNRNIRRLLHMFDQSAYVGYTATPFANIFIHENARTNELGEDLFPRSFIVSLPTPSNHVGPSSVFGSDSEGAADAGLPLVRIIDDHAASHDPDETSGWVPPRHKKEHLPRYAGQNGVPPSLAEAIRAFILTIAARMARGQDRKHNSMLVHVTRYTAVQGHVFEQVSEELAKVNRRLRVGDGDSAITIEDELQRLWNRDFAPTTRQASESINGIPEVQDWDEVAGYVRRAALSIKVRQINGYAGEVLDYVTHADDGLNVIAIGGDKLSRGLTLEGLTVSYFLRASRMYDTLMQMGRWFGYRPGYVDLCRLYTTSEMADWFAVIARATDELRQDFDRMAAAGSTPREFGHRVKSHPGLLVTSRVKMRNGKEIDLTFNGDISETINFFRTGTELTENWQAGVGLAEAAVRVGKVLRVSGLGWARSEVPVGAVLDFLTNFHAHPAALRVIPKLLADYVRAENDGNRLTDWTVFVAGGNSRHSERIGGSDVPLVQRAWHLSASTPEGKEAQKARLMRENHFRIRRLLNPSDEMVDLTDTQKQRALQLTHRDWQQDPDRAGDLPSIPSGPRIRECREARTGLIMLYPLDAGDDADGGLTETAKTEASAAGVPVLGFAISFPRVTTVSASRVRYVVNNVYFRQEVLDLGAGASDE
jgi:hypothetical protein